MLYKAHSPEHQDWMRKQQSYKHKIDIKVLKMKRYIWVKFQKEGIHKYPRAATDPKLAEVSFLGNEHRHIFHFKVQLEVFHDDRDVEFILFKRELESLYDKGTMQADFQSCEMMAEDLYEYIKNHYPDRGCLIDVSEDGENGCQIDFRS